jgi:hypothetical protein
LEKRDPEFEPKMAEILCVYRQVALLRAQEQAAAGVGGGIDGSQAIISYDEKFYKDNLAICGRSALPTGCARPLPELAREAGSARLRPHTHRRRSQQGT